MTLEFKNGDLFSEKSEALVNTVNCVGVMGKGVALEFKRRWVENFNSYRVACKKGAVTPGSVFVFDRGWFDGGEPRYILNFATKDHWRSQSQISYVEDGLDNLIQVINKYNIKSVAMPPLGCGNGGLDWSIVKEIIIKKLERIDGVNFVVLTPRGDNLKPEYTGGSFGMTYPRAILLKSLNDLEIVFDGYFDRISLQKIVYFLQEFGVVFGLKFTRSLYGPYSEPLKRAFIAFENAEMISGFVTGDRMSRVTPAGYAAAEEYLSNDKRDSSEVINNISRLIQGYESPYGLELLSSVHYLAHYENRYPIEKIISELYNWNEHKCNSYSDEVIRNAYKRLVDDNLLN